MTGLKASKKEQVLDLIRANPYLSQMELAQLCGISRSAVATHISSLIQEGKIIGRAYVLPERGKVTCIGGANVDRKIQSQGPLKYGTSNPAQVVQSHGGVARNIAENLGRMGADVTLVTMVGKDAEGDSLLHHCSAVGVDTSQAFRCEDERTGTYTAVLDSGGDMAVALADMAIYDGFDCERIRFREAILKASEFVVVDTNLPSETLKYVVEFAANAKVQLCIVPVSSPKAMRLPERLHGVYLLVANLDEIAAITGKSTTHVEGIWVAVESVLARGCANVIVTRGKEGVLFAGSAGSRGSLAAASVHVKDVTGAGDAFVAGVVYSLLQGASLEQACKVALRVSKLTLETEETVSSDMRAETLHNWLNEALMRKGENQ